MRTLAVIAAVATATPAAASELRGPGRFCGYAPIIDLREGERIVTLQGGIHGGTFRWEGPWGVMTVTGMGIGAPIDAWPGVTRNAQGHLRSPVRRDGKDYVVVLWNERMGIAYFRSRKPPGAIQLAAIDRVDLFQEGEEPEGCKLRTVFSWEVGA